MIYDGDYWSLTAATQQYFSYIGTDSLCCVCQRRMTETMEVRATTRKGSQADTLGNPDQQ